jgi:hypothetical protein
MWIEFSIYFLGTNFSPNNLNVFLVPEKSSTWVILLARVVVDPKKIEAMQDWPHPKTLKILRGFMGLSGYYSKFVKN